MELNHLKYFCYVAKEGGFSKAARTMRIAQPAITKMVKNLESSLGVELFERTGRNVRLTKVGADVFRKCEVIFAQTDDILNINAQRSAAKDLRGTLNIAAAEPIAGYIVPVEIRETHPITYKLVVATEHAKSAAVCSSFIGSREVDDVANKTYPTLTKLRKKYGGAEIKISSNSLTAHRQMVLAGLGVSILPEFMVADDIAAKRLSCLLKDENFTFQLKVVTQRNRHLSRQADAFLALLNKVA